MQERRIEEDEIDLRELFLTLWAKRSFIIIFTLLVTICAVIYAYMKTPIYEVKSTLELGSLNNKAIHNSKDLVKKLRIINHVEDKVQNSKEKSSVTDISSVKNLPNFILVKTEGISNEDAITTNKNILKQINDDEIYTINHYKHKIEKQIIDTKRVIQNIDLYDIPLIEQQIKEVDSLQVVRINRDIQFLKDVKVFALTKEIQVLNTTLKNLKVNLNKKIPLEPAYIIKKSDMESQYLSLKEKVIAKQLEKDNIIKNVIPDLIDKINDYKTKEKNTLEKSLKNLRIKKLKLLDKITDIKTKLSIEYIKPTKIVGTMVIKDHPIKPKKKLIVVVAFVTGFILSIFIVFFMQFINGFKEEREEK